MRFLRLILLIIGGLLVVALVGGWFVYRDITRGPLPTHSGTLTVPGLADTVEIIRDERGVPHIYATNAADLFFAQGYVQAQDRWWQMEFSRHTGSGTLSQLIGDNDEIKGIDVFIRTAGWRQSAVRDFEAMPTADRVLVEAFADGVNAYIADKPPTDLAMEYSVLGLTGINFDIKPWTPVDSLVWGKVMAWDLAGDRSRELLIASLLEDERVSDDMLSDLYPGFPYGQMPTILQAEDIPFLTETTADHPDPTRTTVGAVTLAGSVPYDLNVAFGHGLSVGSNNWVVSGDRTASGLPLLANDMHLSVGIPAIWYEIGLHCQPVTETCPYNVRGFALPATPAVIAGHNDRIGWALTNVGPDTQDMYLLRVDEADPLVYEWNGEPRQMTTREEVIRFGDGTPPLTFTVRETHLGPVMNDNSFAPDGALSGFNTDNPMALRWTATDEPSSLFTALLQLNRAGDWEAFRAALEMWDSPSQNILYADVGGNIGYQMPGRIPYRAGNHDGLLPAPGWTDEYEWRGYIPFDDLPRTYNPPSGYIGSANQPAAPLGYFDALSNALGNDVNARFQTSVAYGYRAVALSRLLEDLTPHSVETFREMQADTYSDSAAQLVPFFTALDYEDPMLNDYRDWLGTWDYHYRAESSYAFLYAHVWSRLLRVTYLDQLPSNYNLSGNERIQWVTFQLMSDPQNPWWDDLGTVPTETRDDILRQVFEQAVTDAENTVGPDRDTWRWDTIHRVRVIHNPLGLSGIGLIEDSVNRGPYPVGGTDGALNNMRWEVVDGTFDVSGSVVSMRSIVDFSDFVNNRSVIPTGQSGHPFSVQYGDQLEAWTTGTDYPMYWSRDTVEASANTQTLILQPE